MATWVVQIPDDPLQKLGIRLALSVPGEWEAVAESHGLSYRRRCDPERRALDILQLAEALAVFLLEDFQPDWVTSAIQRHYPYFSAEEREAVAAYARGHLDPSPHEYARRHDQVRDRLALFLSDHHQVVVEGVVTFLLQDLGREIEAAVDQAVDDLLLENEHREFVELLRKFLAGQGAKVEEAHLLVTTQGFRVEDADGRPLGQDARQELQEGLSGEGSADDLLVSLLLTVAPVRLIIHRGCYARDRLNTVEVVFQERIRHCPGCPRCEHTTRPAVDGSRPRR